MKALFLLWWRWLAGHAGHLRDCARDILRDIWDGPAPGWAVPPTRSRKAPSPGKFTPEQHTQRAAEARRILEHPLFIEAANAVDDSLATARARVPMEEATMHTRLILAEQSWMQLRRYFHKVIMDGELVRQDILKAENARQRLHQAFRRGIRA